MRKLYIETYMERRLSDVYSWARRGSTTSEERTRMEKDCRKGSKDWRAWYSWSVIAGYERSQDLMNLIFHVALLLVMEEIFGC